MTHRRSLDRATPREVTLRYGQRRITAREGQTVAAALVAQDVPTWRTTRRAGRSRGLFCGIGVCYDCLLTIDGHPDQRACLVEVADGMVLGDLDPAEHDGPTDSPSGAADQSACSGAREQTGKGRTA